VCAWNREKTFLIVRDDLALEHAALDVVDVALGVGDALPGLG